MTSSLNTFFNQKLYVSLIRKAVWALASIFAIILSTSGVFASKNVHLVSLRPSFTLSFFATNASRICRPSSRIFFARLIFSAFPLAKAASGRLTLFWCRYFRLALNFLIFSSCLVFFFFKFPLKESFHITRLFLCSHNFRSIPRVCVSLIGCVLFLDPLRAQKRAE